MRVLYLTPSSFRSVNAGALRNVNLARAIALEGNQVSVLCGDAPGDGASEGWSGLLGDGVTLSQRGADRGGQVGRLRRLVAGLRVFKSELLEADLIVMYNPNPLQYLRVRALLRGKEAGIVVDVSEWLALTDHPAGRLSPYSWVYELFMWSLPWLLGSHGKAVAISRPMADHLSRSGADVLVVPPLSSVSRIDREDSGSEGPCRVVLSGSGISQRGKDSEALALLLRIAEECPDDLEGLQFDILGTLDDKTAQRIEALSNQVRFNVHGWLDWEKALEVVRSADWLFLLRDAKNRRHRVGFPSKITESLSAGTAVIVNECGGMTDYLTDGANAIITGTANASIVQALGRCRELQLKVVDDRFHPGEWAARVASFMVKS